MRILLENGTKIQTASIKSQGGEGEERKERGRSKGVLMLSGLKKKGEEREKAKA